MMQGLAAGFLPHNSGFPLVGDADGLYIQLAMLSLCCAYSLLYTLLDSLPYFLRIMLYPAAGSQHRFKSSALPALRCTAHEARTLPFLDTDGIQRDG